MPLVTIVAIIGAGLIIFLMLFSMRQRRKSRRLDLQLLRQGEILRSCDRQRELLFASNPYPMWSLDRKTLRFLTVNEAAIRQYGYSREEFLNMSLTDIRPREDVPALLEVLARNEGGLRQPGLWRHLRKDGSIILVEISSYQYEQDGETRETVVALDVTERRRMEEALRESEATLKALVDNAPFGIAQASLHTNRITTVNPTLLEMLGGYSFEEALQLDPGTQIYADAKDRDTLIDVLRRSGKVKAWETNLKRRNGTLIPVRLTGLLTPAADGKPERFSTYVEDITQQSSLERQVRQVQKLEAVGRLAGGMAHDFNNVLVVIKLSTEMMLGEITPDSPFSKPLLQISNAADRAAALTKQMLAFSRQQMMQPRIINLNSVVNETAHMLRRVIGEDIELVTDLAPTIENSKLDPDQVTQVVLNLAVNARDAMPQGGTLHIETSSRTLDEAYAREHSPVQPGNYVMMSVSDTGTGIDRSILPRIFDPFFTTKEVGKGTGLGLSIVYGIVKQSGGYIWVYSEPGHGTTFKIYFPATTAALDRPAMRSGNASRPSGQLVLIVEDEPGIRTNIRDCLEQLGYRVLMAGGGDAALRICDDLEGKLDLVITDLIMSGKTGDELAHDLAERYPDVRILFMSGYTENSATRRDVLIKGSPFLQKPFSVAELANAVQSALALKADLV
jgi:two-component system cell cycle sensor histidine kinase/response regulator CckA